MSSPRLNIKILESFLNFTEKLSEYAEKNSVKINANVRDVEVNPPGSPHQDHER